MTLGGPAPDDGAPRPAGPLPWPPPLPPGVVPESVFYGGAPRPAPEPSAAERIPTRLVTFGALLFGVGWLGILFQRGVIRQLIVGAPLFEELAKLGPPLVVVGALGLRALWARLPLAWTSGAGFGVFEHHLTYPEEEPLYFGLRITFHTVTCGLSMAAFTLLEGFADPRTRWASTVAASLIHAANNLGALVLSILSLFAHVDPVATAWSALMSLAAIVLTARVAFAPASARALALDALRRMAPSLVRAETGRAAPPPRAWAPPPPEPPGP